jgi:hypothetical protein
VTVGVTRIGQSPKHMRLAKAVNSRRIEIQVGKKIWLEKFCHSHRNRKKGAHLTANRAPSLHNDRGNYSQ